MENEFFDVNKFVAELEYLETQDIEEDTWDD